ncbi:MAG: T9SS type A sorting domain-containing protein [Bacteroidales bacterium]|nr:T9SS type A sorting domain-containing protein [Bacteroidales bacterium]MCF8403468.1 T9SS type A sorting domain-containing protein [Bacteroidales bacterium]
MKNNDLPHLFFLILFSFTAMFTFSQNIPDFLVNELSGSSIAGQSASAIGGDGNGHYIVVWSDHRNGYNYDIYAQVYAGFEPVGENFRVNDEFISAAQHYTAIAVNNDMEFVIAWAGYNDYNYDVYAQRYFSEGIPQGSNFKVNDDNGTEDQVHPSIRIDAEGHFTIVWADERSGEYDIYGQNYQNDGTPSGSNFLINDDTESAPQYWPDVAGRADGNWVVTWIDQRIMDKRDVFAQRYASDGTPIGVNFKVNSDPGDNSQLRPDVAIDQEGDFIIAWGDNRNANWDVYWQLYDSNGNPIGDNVMLADNPTGTYQRNPSVSYDAEGDFKICWEDNRDDYNDVYARRFAWDGTALGDAFLVNDDNSGEYQYQSQIFVQDNGDFMITWDDFRFGYNGDVFCQQYLSDGTAVEDNRIVNGDVGSENQFNPSIALSNEYFILTWEDYRDGTTEIYSQRFFHDGTFLGENFKVNEDMEYGYALSPAAAATPNGSFVISWADFRNMYCFDIYAQRYSAGGEPLGENFVVTTTGACMRLNPDIVCKDNGDFIITWNDADEGGFENIMNSTSWDNSKYKPEIRPGSEEKGSEPDIYGQMFSSDGIAVGNCFMVNDDSSYAFQTDPTIAIDPDGNFVIAWEDNRNGPWHVYLQRYSGDGTPVGENFRVEDYLFLTHQLEPSISMDSLGNFNVSWMDHRNGNADIFCRRFFGDGTPIEDSFQVNDDPGEAHQAKPSISTSKSGKFIIEWNDSRNETDDVYAQRYDLDATPVGINFIVPNTNSMMQQWPVVAIDDERVFSSWQDNRGGQTGFDIYASVLNWDLVSGSGPDQEKEELNSGFTLQVYPNPSRQFANISYELVHPGIVSIDLLNAQGVVIENVFSCHQEKGEHSFEMDCSLLNPGLYFYRISFKHSFVGLAKMLVK